MKRSYQKRPLFGRARLGQLGLAAFVIFIALRILTPPSDATEPVVSPDGSKEARLKTVFFYDNQPSYKIHWRESGKTAWLSLQNFPAVTNAPAGVEAELEWNETSDRVDFLLNGTSVWHHSFSE